MSFGLKRPLYPSNLSYPSGDGLQGFGVGGLRQEDTGTKVKSSPERKYMPMSPRIYPCRA